MSLNSRKNRAERVGRSSRLRRLQRLHRDWRLHRDGPNRVAFPNLPRFWVTKFWAAAFIPWSMVLQFNGNPKTFYKDQSTLTVRIAKRDCQEKPARPTRSLRNTAPHAGATGTTPDPTPDPTKDPFVFVAQVAVEKETRERGLGFRKTPLGPHEAMLFVYEVPRQVSFWMKETYIPLSISYFSVAGKILKTYDMPVEKDPKNPKANYPSPPRISAALETRLGGLPKHGILCVKIEK